MKRKLVLSPDGEPEVVPMPEPLNPFPIVWFEGQDEIYDFRIDQKYEPIREWIIDFISNHENIIISTVPNLIENGYVWTAEQTIFTEGNVNTTSYQDFFKEYFDTPEYKVLCSLKLLVDVPHVLNGTDERVWRGSDYFQVILYRQMPNNTKCKIDFISRKLHINLLLDDLD